MSGLFDPYFGFGDFDQSKSSEDVINFFCYIYKYFQLFWHYLKQFFLLLFLGYEFIGVSLIMVSLPLLKLLIIYVKYEGWGGRIFFFFSVISLESLYCVEKKNNLQFFLCIMVDIFLDVVSVWNVWSWGTIGRRYSIPNIRDNHAALKDVWN